MEKMTVGVGEGRLIWTDNYTWQSNESIILHLADRGMSFPLATKPNWDTWSNMLTPRGDLNIFGREVLTLGGRGYTETNAQGVLKLVPPAFSARISK
jgi:hypothetical protein